MQFSGHSFSFWPRKLHLLGSESAAINCWRKVPEGADLTVFLLSDGRLTEKPVIEKPMLLWDLF